MAKLTADNIISKLQSTELGQKYLQDAVNLMRVGGLGTMDVLRSSYRKYNNALAQRRTRSNAVADYQQSIAPQANVLVDAPVIRLPTRSDLWKEYKQSCIARHIPLELTYNTSTIDVLTDLMRSPIGREDTSPHMSLQALYETCMQMYNERSAVSGREALSTPISISIIPNGRREPIDYHFANIWHLNNFYLFAQARADGDEGWYDSATQSLRKGTKASNFGAYALSVGGCSPAPSVSGLRNFRTMTGKIETFVLQTNHKMCAVSALEYSVNGQKYDYEALRNLVSEPRYNTESGGYLFSTEARKHGVDISQLEAVITSNNIFKNIIIITKDTDLNTLLPENKYILWSEGHYFPVKSWEIKIMKTKREQNCGLMVVDLETRRTDEYVTIGTEGESNFQKIYKLKDTITCCYLKRYQSDVWVKYLFATEPNGKSSAEIFMDFLRQESFNRHYYKIVAHNGGNFDYYFLKDAMTKKEIEKAGFMMRGMTIMTFKFHGNEFKDTCLFMPFSLEKLCVDFKVGDQSKITEVEIQGKKYTNKQLCFYRSDLTFDEFMNLQETDKEFWKIYTKYCMMDCVSLSIIWGKFKDTTNELLSRLGNKSNIDTFLTIGSCAMRTLQKTLKKKPILADGEDGTLCMRRNTAQKLLFMFIEYSEPSRKKKPAEEKPKGSETKEQVPTKVNMEKINFIRLFNVGGISHCNKPAVYTDGVVSVDIASQYPSSMRHMKVPAGASRWLEKDSLYNSRFHGFYELEDLQFKEGSPVFKPICTKGEVSLKWNTGMTIAHSYCDSYMIKFLMKNCGLESFKIVKALVSNCEIEGKDIFGPYVDVFYNEKMRQDSLKGKPEYNNVVRECCKLFLNSLGGKCVEDPSKHTTLIELSEYEAENGSVYDDGSQTREYEVKIIGGVKFAVIKSKQINPYVALGAMIYSHSKRLIWTYANATGSADNIIHIETDSLYFETKYYNTFLDNIAKIPADVLIDYPCKLGSNLGNMKKEHDCPAGTPSYFLGKKTYYMFDGAQKNPNLQHICRWKGMAATTIDEDGNDVPLITPEFYKLASEGAVIPKTMNKLKKVFEGTSPGIFAYKLTRRVKACAEYKDKLPKDTSSDTSSECDC